MLDSLAAAINIAISIFYIWWIFQMSWTVLLHTPKWLAKTVFYLFRGNSIFSFYVVILGQLNIPNLELWWISTIVGFVSITLYLILIGKIKPPKFKIRNKVKLSQLRWSPSFAQA